MSESHPSRARDDRQKQQEQENAYQEPGGWHLDPSRKTLQEKICRHVAGRKGKSA
ncbi:MAG: hypothetical protein ACTHKB_00300 [Burkholderiaceae bacterium]